MRAVSSWGGAEERGGESGRQGRGDGRRRQEIGYHGGESRTRQGVVEREISRDAHHAAARYLPVLGPREGNPSIRHRHPAVRRLSRRAYSSSGQSPRCPLEMTRAPGAPCLLRSPAGRRSDNSEFSTNGATQSYTKIMTPTARQHL